MSSSKVIVGVESDAWRRWHAPSVETDPASTCEPENVRLPTEQELQALREAAREAAFEEGFAAGRKQGIESGRAEVEAQAHLFGELAAALAQPFEDLDRRVEEELVALAIALVRQLVRREVRADPEVVLGAVRESLRVLPASSRDIRIVLHPEDAKIVRRFLVNDQQEESWKITENPGFSRGGCKVITNTSQIDATLEHRLIGVINAVFGGERSTDEPSDEPTAHVGTASSEEDR